MRLADKDHYIGSRSAEELVSDELDGHLPRNKLSS